MSYIIPFLLPFSVSVDLAKSVKFSLLPISVSYRGGINFPLPF